ncbi:hypothetical protein D3C73_670310 [compost metagenome]
MLIVLKKATCGRFIRQDNAEAAPRSLLGNLTLWLSDCGVGGVLDHGNAVFVGEGVKRIEIECRTGVIHRDDGFGARRDRRFDIRTCIKSDSYRSAVKNCFG